MRPQPVIYLCRYSVAGAAPTRRHAVALERGPRTDDEYDALPDVLAEVLGRGIGVDPDVIVVVEAERADVGTGLGLAVQFRLHAHAVAIARQQAAEVAAEQAECQGHESLAGEHMGEAVYCDGTCRPRRARIGAR